jgi:hypothetical protein
LDDILRVISTSQKLLKLVIIIRRVGSALSGAQPAQTDSESISNWIKIVKLVQGFIKSAQQEGNDHISHEVTDAVCFMVRVLHLYVELRGPDLGSNAVDTISILFELAVVGYFYLLADEAY